jgi:MoaA/NifB/PqqE/SkfB family radical SAM enzyme
MRCNLACEGCYSRFHPREEEMSDEVLDRLISSAMAAGVFFFIITGGEPYLRPGIVNLFARHRRGVFLTITNGTLIDGERAAHIARAGNIFPIVSVEGDEESTDRRRGTGIYAGAIGCMRALRDAGVLFGFSAVLTNRSIGCLGSDGFIEEMRENGCTFGFFTEIIPVCDEDRALLPAPDQSSLFREWLSAARRRTPPFLVLLPDDEYDREGWCRGVAEGGMHVNSQGFVEPCPFAHFARENVTDHTFEEVLSSPFLRALREHPSALKKGATGCALSHNRDTLQMIARETGACATRRNPAMS